MSKLYTPEGWINWDYISGRTRAFCMVIGARGTGKTYGLLRQIAERGERFIYLRRLATQLDASGTEDGNPFKKINADAGCDIHPVKRRGLVRYLKGEGEDCELAGYGLALSTVATVRGIDFSDVSSIVFDEAVPMEGERTIKNEFTALLNFYETVNRNRELEGRAPVKCFLLGNANKLSNPYLTGWKCMLTALHMLRGRQMVFEDSKSGLLLIMLQDSPISKRKGETALYKAGPEGFRAMALDNAFYTDATNIAPLNLRECAHIVSCGEMGIYRHKGTGDLYVCSKPSKDNYYDGAGVRLKMFRFDYRRLYDYYISGLMRFESYEVELLFREYFAI